MKVVILAGGKGTRISEETEIKPKPMVEIGGKPILWHIMKIYSSYGFNDFIVCLGYLGYVIKEYFSHYFLHANDIIIDMKTNKISVLNSTSEPWKITLLDTGIETMTGGRLKRIKKYLGQKTFMMTYGDGLSDVNINKLVQFHRVRRKLATVLAVKPLGRFGSLEVDRRGNVCSFQEKPRGDKSWINGGFFVLEPEVLDYIVGDETLWEKEPMEKLAREGQLVAYCYDGFWDCMDTLRDKVRLEQLWQSGRAPWKVWK